MLRVLSIQNYAIIDQLRIEFSGQLNVITGETGAGKSILVGALGLILGQRADPGVLLQKEKKCVVEGTFTATGKTVVRDFLLANELDPDDELILRREIGSNGKSRAFVNDTPVNLSQIQQLTSLLVDLHQQFDTIEVGDTDFQREVIDALSGQPALFQEYGRAYASLNLVRRELAKLRTQKEQIDKEADYQQFQFNELEEANFKENELEEADAEMKLLSNSEGIKAALERVMYGLDEGEQPLVQQLKVMSNQLQPFASVHASIASLVARLQSAYIELQDLSGEVASVSNEISYDPARVEQLSERISLGYKLQKKHGVKTTAELLAIREELSRQIDLSGGLDDRIHAGEAEQARLRDEASKMAKKITALRSKQLKPLEDQVNELLGRVGMPNARLKVELNTGELNAHGADQLTFLFDGNKSGRFQPVSKVASGGELSRLMLCIKSLVARYIDLPTLIFDEIDTGISGEAARQVGIIMKELSAQRQVLTITHQPQIAGKADAHFFVYKDPAKEMVRTSIRRLGQDERIIAIARMLSGEKPSAASLENAREMIGLN